MKTSSDHQHREHLLHCQSLCCACSGARVCIESLGNDAPEAARLRDLGLCEGACVTVVRDGNPLIVRVADARFGVARRIAEKVLCSPLD